CIPRKFVVLVANIGLLGQSTGMLLCVMLILARCFVVSLYPWAVCNILSNSVFMAARSMHGGAKTFSCLRERSIPVFAGCSTRLFRQLVLANSKQTSRYWPMNW